MDKKINLLVNLPSGFFSDSRLEKEMQRMAALANLRKTSHNTGQEIKEDLGWCDAVIMWAWPNLTDELLAGAPNLRFAGFINVTQTTARACFKKGVAVSEARRGWSPAVAELALALALNGLRRVSFYHMAMKEGSEPWVNDFPLDIDSRERQLTNRPVGIVGFGGIGQRIAQLMQPFNVKLRIYDPYIPRELAEKYGAEQTTVKDLIAQSDVVILCAANNEASRHLVGREEIAAFRKDAVLVNIGRSSLIDMNALVERLKKNDMVAMLDVFDVEPLEKDSELRKLPNAFLTPHRGGGIMESVQRILNMLVDDLEAFLEGRERKYVLTESMLTSLPD